MVRSELCGKFMLEDGFCHMKRRMDMNELIFMTEGEMYICEDEQDFYTVQAGDVLFLRAGREHRGFKVSEGPVSFFWFHYTSDHDDDNNLISHFTPKKTGYIAQLYNQLFRFSKTSRETADCAATLLIAEVRSAAEKTLSPSGEIAEEIRSYIEAAPSKKLTPKKIADRFGYSPDYISSLLRELTGYSVKNYITHLRMDRAMELLLSSDLNFKQIAYRCGYEDYSQFLKLFKKYCGTTPTDYRRNFRSSIINTTTLNTSIINTV